MSLDIFNEFYIALSGVAIILFAITIIKAKNGLDKKNLSLMQLYLELKFLCKNLADSVEVGSSENFCIELISSMKEYYNLEEIIIVDSIKMEFKSNRLRVLKKEIYNFLQDHSVAIKNDLKTEDFIVKEVEINNKKYILYITELSSSIHSNGFIICVENFPALLSKHEVLGLEGNINLLKTRLLYD